MGRVSQEEERAIREAVELVRRVEIGREGLAEDLLSIVDRKPPLESDEDVERALETILGPSREAVPYTAGNEASERTARRLKRRAEECAAQVFAEFLAAVDGAGLTNADLYDAIDGFSELTINRRVSELKAERVIEESGTRDVPERGSSMTVHRLAPAVRAYYEGDRGTQEVLL